jgi:pimeloyl-ACP methyl ester carboxylesterase
VLVGWSYGGFVICDYLRAYGEDAVAAINFVGAAVTLNPTLENIGPAFLANAPAGSEPDLPTRIAALRRFWHRMTVEPLDPADLETGLSGSVSVPPEVLGALISRQIDSDDVLRRLRMPVLVTHGRRDEIVLPAMAEHILRTCPTATASWYDRVGHAPFIEDARRFNSELGDLVQRTAS